MRFGSIPRGDAGSTQLIFCRCYDLKMRWVDARGIATEMIYHKTIRDWSNEKLVGKAMCPDEDIGSR